MQVITRRNFLKVTAATVAAGTLADATIFERDFPQLVQIEIPLARLPMAWDGLRIAQLSDFHYEGRLSAIPIRKAIAMVNSLRPDLALLTGDFVTVGIGAHRQTARRAARSIEPCALLMGEIHARLGTFAVLGNHDAASDPDRIVAALNAQKIGALVNRSVFLEQQGSRLWIAGLGDALEGTIDLHSTLRGIPAGEPVVLMAHEPDLAINVAGYPVDLQLSGHSHGGQVRFPLIGAPVLPDLAHKFPWGLHRVGNLTLYTNIGIGTVRLPVRFNCPPEVTLITLRAASEHGQAR